MQSITRKPVILEQVKESLTQFSPKKIHLFVDELEKRLLQCKIKFPLLEYATLELMKLIPEDLHLRVADEISRRRTIGGNVMLGIILQKKLTQDMDTSFQKAAAYIESGAEWYVTDIIGERVFGVALLTQFNVSLKKLKVLSKHPCNWVVRAIGPGAHYAIKKGLPEKETAQVFKLLLSLGNAADFHIKSGIGWAAKTTAKFHPKLIERHQNEIAKTGPWFKTKIRIGLERHAYVQARRSKKHTE